MLARALQTTRGRLALLVVAVALVMFSTAALLHFAFDRFDTYGEALWSAAVHQVDPGALIDDEGGAERALGMFQAIAGLVLLIGLLFEVISESVGRSLERLGQSDRPIRARGHLLIVGGADLVAVAAKAAADATHLRPAFERIVVLAPERDRESREEIRGGLREAVGHLRFDLLFGTASGDGSFELAAAEHAAAILVMPSRSGPVAAETADVETTIMGLALNQYLYAHQARPDVCLLFRRGRNADATAELLPDGWNAVVGDRTVTALMRLAVTQPTALAQLERLGVPSIRASTYPDLVRAAWNAAQGEARPLRLAIIGCNFDAPALMEDLAEAGARRFDVTVIAERDVFERYLGEGRHSGVNVRFLETRLDDPDRLEESLSQTVPDVVVVAPSPRDDLRTSDAAALLTLLRVRQAAGERTPIVFELFLPHRLGPIRSDPRLLPISGLETVTAAIALTVFDPEEAEQLTRRLSAAAVEADEG
jgi:hypothetical protein